MYVYVYKSRYFPVECLSIKNIYTLGCTEALQSDQLLPTLTCPLSILIGIRHPCRWILRGLFAFMTFLLDCFGKNSPYFVATLLQQEIYVFSLRSEIKSNELLGTSPLKMSCWKLKNSPLKLFGLEVFFFFSFLFF